MKRVLLLSEPGRDGVLFFVAGLIHHLHLYHPTWEVDFLYSSRRGGPDLQRLVEKVVTHGGQAIDLAVGNAPRLADAVALGKILRFVRARRPDIVHAHSSKAGGLARLAALFPGFPPVLYTPHAYLGLQRSGSPKELFFNLLEAFLGRLATTQNCSADERAFARHTLRLPPRSLVLINNGINTRRFAPVDPATQLARRKELGLPAEGRLLVTIGRDAAQKNYPALYRALEGFLPEAPLTFAHAGAGATLLRNTLSPAARERCHCWEHLDRPERLLQAADGFVLASHYEGLSFAMLEALACGLSPILTDGPGLQSLKPLGFRSVTWIAPGHAAEQAIRAALVSWSNAPLPPSERDRVLALFDERVQFEKLTRIYQWLAQRPAG